jgi:hypothetical protein
MRTQPSSRILANHPPKEYYEAWASVHGLDLNKYPYLKSDFVPTKGILMPFAVFDFNIMKNEDGVKVAMIEVWYKSLFSKDSFRVIAYL